MLVDDHVLFRKGLAGLLASRPSLQVVGEVGNGEEAIAAVDRLRPDLVLMDVNMPIMNGIEATRQIHRAHPELPVVMLTVSDRDENLFEAIKAGAQGYLLKDLEPEELFRYIEGVFRGEAPISGSLARLILQEFARMPSVGRRDGLGTPRGGEAPAEAEESEGLTEREREVLQLVASGATNREIAQRLIISENTVKIHIKHILDKLHVQNRVQAAAYAIEEGLVEPKEPPRA
ncbi:MAG: response regulator transcription factor [Clostridia bacterium]|nr:response regulator transcription factor [Clostridia bacterium]MCL6522411.1 response regulator transcription factor [Bacillota bacterium]